MANQDQRNSTAESARQDLSGAIRVGKDTAKAGKTVARAAAQVSHGNAAGAVFTMLKDGHLTKRLLSLLVAAAISFALLGLFFLYALPVSIYEVSVSYFEEVQETWRQQVYDGGGDITFRAVMAAVHIGEKAVGDFFQGVWQSIQGLFTKDAGGDTGAAIDSLSDSAIELQVTQKEQAEKQTLEQKLNACIRKIDARAEEIESSIQEQRTAIAAAVEAHCNKDGAYDAFQVEIQVTRNSMSQSGALELLSLYTVQRGASLEELQLSDLMRWLGWYDSRNTGTTSFTLGGIGVSGTVKTWNGTFMPQYLVEQRRQERHLYQEEKTDFASKSCAAVDMLLVVDCPYAEEIPVQKSVVYETRQGPDGKEYTVEKTVGTAYVNIQIMPRSAASLSALAGLWEGALRDKQPELQFSHGMDSGGPSGDVSPGSAGSAPIGSPSAQGNGTFFWPLPGHTRLSCPFGWRMCPFHGRELHGAVDIPAPGGTPILAGDSGTVTVSKYNSSLGNYVRINHGSGYESMYCHMSSRGVSVGDVVAQGQVIGYVGTTGSSTGNHLHFAIYRQGTPVDPMQFHYINRP